MSESKTATSEQRCNFRIIFPPQQVPTKAIHQVLSALLMCSEMVVGQGGMAKHEGTEQYTTTMGTGRFCTIPLSKGKHKRCYRWRNLTQGGSCALYFEKYKENVKVKQQWEILIALPMSNFHLFPEPLSNPPGFPWYARYHEVQSFIYCQLTVE